MRKGIRFLICFASLVLVMGVIVLVVAYKFDFTVDASGKSINNEYLIDKSFTSIDIDVSTTNIEINRSDSSDCKIFCKEKTKIYNDVYVENDTLKIRQKDKRKWYEEILNFDIFNYKVTIYLPNDNYDKLNVDSSTGNVKIYGDFTFNDINIDLSTGNVRLENVISNDLNVDSSTGNIYLENCDFNTFDLDASTGNITAHLITRRSVKTHSSTGKIKVVNSLSCEPTCFANTSTGNITIVFKTTE